MNELWQRLAQHGIPFEDVRIQRFSQGGTWPGTGVQLDSIDGLFMVRCAWSRSYEANLRAAVEAVLALVESAGDGS